ncbi:unnamed protein product [Caenorhabditis angaria]|uniref:Gem-associated protein 2 n=1 Tax=Caenorhabditis angaria TaxID=860376 RepID=A0A9P1N295_9PELO|nr:unnamed protein product [Caenorhabditis angaria]
MDQEACLAIEDDESCSSYSMENVAMSAGEYLKQVRETRKYCEDVVRIDGRNLKIKQNGKKWEGTKGLNLKEENVECQTSLVPSKEWQEAKSHDFASKRDQLEEFRKTGKIRAIQLKLPRMSEEEEWHQFLLEKCAPKAESLKSKFENHVGTPPALSVVFGFAPRTVNELITYLVEWSESEGLTRPIREWIFALILVVQLPLLPDVISSLRDLVKICKKVRSTLSADRIDESNEFSMFIAVVSLFFNQKDLTD